MKNQREISNNVFPYLKTKHPKQCTENMHVEVAVIGGGIAGLSAAQAFADRGKKVAVFEQHFCGSGATGKGGGFVTPNAELSLSDFSNLQSNTRSQEIWKFINSGLEKIRTNIKDHSFNAGYIDSPGLFVANCHRTFKNLATEYEKIMSLGYESKLFNSKELEQELGSKKYFGAMTYDNCFGMNAYDYCLQLQSLLEARGVQIFEETPVTALSGHTLTTPHATITADYVIVCVDRFLPQLGIMEDEVYHAQNFVLMSEQLSDEQIKKIFPSTQYMVWDSQIVYNYFRINADKRLLLGGGDLLSVHAPEEKYNYVRARDKLTNYFNHMFPETSINFEYQWPGLIGLSKDVSPLAGPDAKHPHIYYISATAGLSIATALGQYSAEHMLEGRTDLDVVFAPNRKYAISGIMQKIMGKRLSFAINNFLTQKTVGCFK